MIEQKEMYVLQKTVELSTLSLAEARIPYSFLEHHEPSKCLPS